MTSIPVDPDRLERCYQRAKETLLAERNARGFWEGELSSSALSTATAVMALEMVLRQGIALHPNGWHAQSNAMGVAACDHALPAGQGVPPVEIMQTLIDTGLRWIAAHQNADGGWGDTTKSISNISTTMLCHAALHAVSERRRGIGDGTTHPPLPLGEGRGEGENQKTHPHPNPLPQGEGTVVSDFAEVIGKAKAYIDRAGGVAAVRARYGKDKTFSIPILTHCALAGLVDWREVSPLPFELACVPAKFYKWLRLPVVSYALPALIAIGQARHYFVKPWNPLLRWLRKVSIEPSLRVLDRIQPTSGGFLEATPLTSFVTMSLAAIGRADHPVVQKGVEFIVRSVRPDGSWPIDTNLATWVTTLSINALGPDLPPDAVAPLREWLLGQQYREVHPYTNADPGGWAWTDLPGGVPDADDTPGAILAMGNIARVSSSFQSLEERALDIAKVADANIRGIQWLFDLQNRDGGWPTFCRGWGALPFDRSGPDLTSHAIRAVERFFAWTLDGNKMAPITLNDTNEFFVDSKTRHRIVRARNAACRFLRRTQRRDGSWLPLWFGNQFAHDDENPTYGTSRVLAAYRDLKMLDDPAAQRGLEWLRRAQNADGGWGGAPNIVSSVEETALAVEALLGAETAGQPLSEPCCRGVNWLLDAVEQGKFTDPSPIGFYFAKLWYFEKLYPIIFTVSALRTAKALITTQQNNVGRAS